jgi:hypothetical protein
VRFRFGRRDVEQGARWFEERLGAPAYVHPAESSWYRSASIQVGPDAAVEILAPDPNHSGFHPLKTIRQTSPCLRQSGPPGDCLDTPGREAQSDLSSRGVRASAPAADDLNRLLESIEAPMRVAKDPSLFRITFESPNGTVPIDGTGFRGSSLELGAHMTRGLQRR